MRLNPTPVDKTLAWLLGELPVEAQARSSGLDPQPLVELRERLVERLLGGRAP